MRASETDALAEEARGGPVLAQRRALAVLVEAAAPTALAVAGAVRARGVLAVGEATQHATRAQLVALVAALAVLVPPGAQTRPGAEWAAVPTYRWSPSTLAVEYARFRSGQRDEVALAAAVEANLRAVETARVEHEGARERRRAALTGAAS